MEAMEIRFIQEVFVTIFRVFLESLKNRTDKNSQGSYFELSLEHWGLCAFIVPFRRKIKHH